MLRLPVLIRRRTHAAVQCFARLPALLLVPIFSVLVILPVEVAAQGSRSLPGHYYLSGMREAASELLLTPDGRFDWVLTYGATNLAARGRWRIDNEIVTLTPDARSGEDVHFQLGESATWNARAAHGLERHLERVAIERRASRCPLRSLSKAFATDTASFEFGDLVPAPSQIAEQAALTTRARRVAQRSLDKLKAHPGWQDDETLTSAADHAIDRFETERATLIGMRDLAGISAPPPEALDAPPECRVADWMADAAHFRGIAVDVFDRERYRKADGIEIKARYDRGAPVAAVVSNGMAFFPLAAGQRIVALTLHVPGARNDQTTTLAVSLGEPTLQLINADLGPVARPPLAALRLIVNPDGSLSTGEELPRGTYRKAVIVPP